MHIQSALKSGYKCNFSVCWRENRKKESFRLRSKFIVCALLVLVNYILIGPQVNTSLRRKCSPFLYWWYLGEGSTLGFHKVGSCSRRHGRWGFLLCHQKFYRGAVSDTLQFEWNLLLLWLISSFVGYSAQMSRPGPDRFQKYVRINMLWSYGTLHIAIFRPRGCEKPRVWRKHLFLSKILHFQ